MLVRVYLYNGFVSADLLGHILNSALCVQGHEVPQSPCGDDWKGILFS